VHSNVPCTEERQLAIASLATSLAHSLGCGPMLSNPAMALKESNRR
jgi:hypothetical protein